MIKRHLSTIAYISTAIVLLISCSKTVKDTTQRSLTEKITIDEAKQWFNQSNRTRARTVTNTSMHSLQKGVFVGEPDWANYYFADDSKINVVLDEGLVRNNTRSYYRTELSKKIAWVI